MSEFTCYVGEQIRRYRKAGNMTLQDLADAIHKSRATICKYENGEISVDVETLYEISQVYDGRSQRTKDGVIDIYEKRGETGKYEATLTICTVSANGRSSEIFYTGRVVYSDMLIRFSFVNQYNPLEEDLLYIFNPLERRDYTMGLLCGISSADLMPCAYKCMVTLTPQEHSERFRSQLLFTKKDLKRLEQLNMLLVDNIEQ